VEGIPAPYTPGPADFLIDVRDRSEQEISMLPGAVAHSPDRDLIEAPGLKAFLANAPQGARVIVYCTVGYRSSRAIAGLKENQSLRIPVYNLEGGIIGHASTGGILITPASGKPTRKVHAYDSFWKQFVRPPLEAVF